MTKFIDIFTDKTKEGCKIPKEDYLPNGIYPIVDQGKGMIAGYTNQKEGLFVDVPAIIFGDHTRIIKYIDFPFFLGADGVKLLKRKANIEADDKYLYYYMKSKHIPNTGYNRHFKWLKETDYKLISLDEQKHIVNVLSLLEHLIALKNKQLLKLDELVKSRFKEVANIFKNNKMNLASCCAINPVKPKDIADDLDCTFVPMTSVSNTGAINTDCIKPYKDLQKGFTYFAENDVLFAKITPCMENGKGCIAKNLYNKIGFGSTEFHVLRPDYNKLNPYWLYILTVMKEFRLKAALNMTGSAGQRRVPASFLQKYVAVVPDMHVQNQFADFVIATDKSKVKIQNSLDKLETLKKSLMQEYFA